MKKILLILLFITSVFANNIKNDYFIGFGYGSTKLTSKSDAENSLEMKLGTYFYDPNIYNISNRVYLNLLKTKTNDNDRIYLSNLQLDWIWTQMPIKPFLGLSFGYLYHKDNPSGTYGLGAGILFYLGSILEIEIGGHINHPSENSTAWPDNVKTIYGSINFSF